MRLLCAAALTTLFGASAAQAQTRGFQYSYGSGYGPAYGYQGGYGVRPAARPSYQYGGGPSPFTWYSPHEGYSTDLQNGLPWRRNTPSGPIGRGGNTSVTRYSRPTQEANETYYARSRASDWNPNSQAKDLVSAAADENDAPAKLPAVAKATRKVSATKKPAVPTYSAAYIRANGGGDWVPNLPVR